MGQGATMSKKSIVKLERVELRSTLFHFMQDAHLAEEK